MRILIAEDDTALAGFVRQGLQGEHYTVDVVEDGEQARAMGTEFDYDLVILDLNLPKLDGVSVLRQLRLKRPSLPVLVLTQRVKVEDRVQCLDTGADDYLPKPFSFSELSARIRALLRRSHLPSESVLQVEDLKLDRVEHRAERAGRRIELTSKEFSLLEYLMRNAGRQVSRAMIIEHVWNLSYDTTTNVVDVYINYTMLYAIERMLGYRTEACLIFPSALQKSLHALASHHGSSDIIFEGMADAGECARIIGNYSAKVGAVEVRVARCGAHLWIRLERLREEAINLVLCAPADVAGAFPAFRAAMAREVQTFQ